MHADAAGRRHLWIDVAFDLRSPTGLMRTPLCEAWLLTRLPFDSWQTSKPGVEQYLVQFMQDFQSVGSAAFIE